jgi:hypothetical protein
MIWSLWPLMAAAVKLTALGGFHVSLNGVLDLRPGPALVTPRALWGVAFAGATVISLLPWDTRPFLVLRGVPHGYHGAGLARVAGGSLSRIEDRRG